MILCAVILDLDLDFDFDEYKVGCVSTTIYICETQDMLFLMDQIININP
jgi:hypothetical protein